MPTTLQFDKDHSITVDEDLAAVESALRTAPPGAISMVSFASKEKTIFVNVSLIRAFREARSRSGVAFG
jgi:hypothetical protein